MMHWAALYMALLCTGPHCIGPPSRHGTPLYRGPLVMESHCTVPHPTWNLTVQGPPSPGPTTYQSWHLVATIRSSPIGMLSCLTWCYIRGHWEVYTGRFTTKSSFLKQPYINLRLIILNGDLQKITGPSYWVSFYSICKSSRWRLHWLLIGKVFTKHKSRPSFHYLNTIIPSPFKDLWRSLAV